MIDSSCLGEALAATARRRGDAPALECDGRWYSFIELDEQAGRIAEALRQAGIRPGDRVAVGLPNSADLVIAVVGVLYAGAVLVPLNPAYTAEELSYVLADCGATLAILGSEHAALLAASDTQIPTVWTALPNVSASSVATAVDPLAPALLVYTSGTTGKPKGATLSHHALRTNFMTVAEAWHWEEDDRLLLVLPCFHLHGLGLGILTSLLVGSSIALRRRFHLEEIVADLERTGATMFFGVPTIYNRLVTLPEDTLASADLSRMRLWVSGSAPLTAPTFERFQQRFGHALMDRYGMTECCFVLSTVYDEQRRAGVVGRPLAGVEVRLVDPEEADRGRVVDVPDEQSGEILVRGPNLFSGYWGRPDATEAVLIQVPGSGGRYLRSGDIAVREGDGQFRIVGRSSVDIIKTRGFKVGAGEIEDVLQRHPAVQEVAVVGLPDADQGELIVAAVTPLPGVAVDCSELIEHARRSLAPHKIPSRIEVVAEIPRTGPGKFKKKELIASLLAGRGV